MRHLAPLIALFALACSDDDGGTTADTRDTSSDSTGDTTTPDTADPDTAEPDTTTPDTTTPDTADPDTADPDTADPDTADPDTADPDTAEPDTTTPDTTPDTSTCEYFEEREVVKCGLAFKQVLHWKDFSGSGCPDYYTFGETRYETIDALTTAESCESCVYVARTSVDFIRCDGQGRSGFDTYASDDEACTDTPYGTPDGIFPDLCLWAVYACYCEEPE